MKIISSYFTSAGPNRAENQDRLLADDDVGFYLVADGMGGHSGGERAAEIATTIVSEKVTTIKNSQDNIGLDSNNFWINNLTEAIESACSSIFLDSQDQPAYKGMGTTLTVLKQISEGTAILAHVGDSRLYLYRSNELYQLTTDHTFVNEMILNGNLDPEQAVDHPYAHVLTRAVGVYQTVAVDSVIFEMMLGDRILICSDGFYDMFSSDQSLKKLLADDRNIDQIMQELKSLPDKLNASDNVTCILLEVAAEKPNQVAAELAKSSEVSLKVEVLRQTSLFNPLELKDIVNLVQAGAVRKVVSGEQIVKEGDIDQSLYVIISGQVDVSVKNEHLCLLNAGTHFGEIPFFIKGPRTATVTATCETMLLELPYSVLESFFKSQPRASVELLKAMAKEFAERLAESNDR